MTQISEFRGMPMSFPPAAAAGVGSSASPLTAPSGPAGFAAQPNRLRARSSNGESSAGLSGRQALSAGLGAVTVACMARHYSAGAKRGHPRSLALCASSSPQAVLTKEQSGEECQQTAITSALAGSVDTIRFDSTIYYVVEGDHESQEARVDVLRFGSLCGTSRVRYFTEDCTAKAGVRYAETSGVLEFEPGESRKTIVIPILDDDGRWNVTLEFQVKLETVDSCTLGGAMGVARVKVIDTNMFPTDDAADILKQLKEGEKNDSQVGNLAGLELFWEYCKFNFNFGDSMARRTGTALLIDQLANVVFLFTTYLLKYAADDVFGATPEIPLLVPGSKPDTLLLVGGLYFGFYLVDLALSLWRESLLIAQTSRVFLQESLFTKYMNYSCESRQKVSSGRLTVAMATSINELVDSGYMKVIELARNVGRLLVSSYFILEENVDAEIPLLVYGICVILFIVLRYKGEADLSEKVVRAESKVAEVVQEGSLKYNLISDYFARPEMINTLGSRSRKLAAASKERTQAQVTNSYFPGGISALLIGVYVYFGGKDVLSGTIEVGVFLTSIALLKEIAESYKEIFVCVLEIARASGAAEALTELLNLPTNLLSMRDREERRREQTKELWRQHEEDILKIQGPDGSFQQPVPTPTGDFCSHTLDVVPIALKDVSFSYCGHTTKILDKVSLSAPQGLLVGVMGKSRSGKSTVLKLLGGVETPDEGSVLLPSYLRTLHVPMEPTLLEGSLWKNLAVGRVYWNDYDFETTRAIDICRRLGFRQSLLKELENSRSAFIADPEADTFSQAGWASAISHTDKVLIHIARSFIFNPEVMVMNRPGIALPDIANQRVLDLLKEFVAERGVGLPADRKFSRRPRTAFVCFSTNRVLQSDVIWEVSQGQIRVVKSQQITDDMMH